MKKGKPEPIRVGVEGIAPAPASKPEQPTQKERAIDLAHMDLAYMVAFPPFQRFAVEKGYSSQAEIMLLMTSPPTQRDGPVGRKAFMSIMIKRSGGDIFALLDEYRQWHAAKGLWPNETPDGRLKVE